IGGIVGGRKGAAIGATVGGGAGTAVVLSTTGDEVELPGGTTLTLSIDAAMDVRVPVARPPAPTAPRAARGRSSARARATDSVRRFSTCQSAYNRAVERLPTRPVLAVAAIAIVAGLAATVQSAGREQAEPPLIVVAELDSIIHPIAAEYVDDAIDRATAS